MNETNCPLNPDIQTGEELSAQQTRDTNETNIRAYAKLMRELDLTALEFTESGRLSRMERACGVSAAAPSPMLGAVPVEEAPQTAGGPCVSSPLVGVFYAAPAENAPPFVKVGDRVKRGDTLCIIEAMKLMNEILAEQDGVVAEICVENGQVVDYGTVLFRMEG
ncbi:MAG: acetyl-CoA carboxylase, biotin carboxyl carrier protein [Oscillospiraceae bacterium]|nr:acetyl-CoA carboxylase, biotin carboxyl carrier protein [Oscillospiraceae bacterium]